jgi:lantibiotic modifying enzyme
VAGPLLVLAARTGDTPLRVRSEELLRATLPGERDAGVWLAYLAARPWLDPNPHCDATLAAALPALLAGGAGNHSLGRGAMGRLDLALTAAEALGDPALRAFVGRRAAAVLDDIQRHGPLTGVPLGVESPGLLAGLAGIGYGLLRLAAPAVVPSLFTTALPMEAVQ